MKNIIAFSGSNSSESINTAVIEYAANLTVGCTVITLTDYDVPMYGIDFEKKNGIPSDILKLQDEIMHADAVIVSTPEHNGLMPAFFKSILDWLSRTGVKYLENKPVLMMSVAPGNGGAVKARDHVERILGYAGATVVGRYSLPRFNDNFDTDARKIVNEVLDTELKGLLSVL